MPLIVIKMMEIYFAIEVILNIKRVKNFLLQNDSDEMDRNI